ncbi:MAG: indolepyruvate ferredoxin oxidoreductase subunit alpha [Candidatus Aminicenantes bacterium]
MKEILSGNEAVARGAYEAGIQIALGYPGTPSSEIIRTIAEEYGKEIYTEWSTNEKVAMDAGAGAAYSGRRSLVTTKQVGMNVLSDSLMYAVYTGMEAALVVVTADDPGLFSSQNEQDNRWYARLAKIPLLEPADSQEAKDFVILAAELSEKFDTPVLIRTVMRTSHSKSVVDLSTRPQMPESVKPFPRDPKKYNCTASNARHMHPRVEQRLLDIAAYAETAPLNRIEWKDRSLGIITSGVLYTYVCDVFPQASVLKLGMTHPLPERMIEMFAKGVEKLVVIEELDPVLEEQIKAMGIVVKGKEIFPRCLELLPDDIKSYSITAGLLCGEKNEAQKREKSDLKPVQELPLRSPVFCAGCPHRSTFYVLNKLKLPVAGDIGCYNLGTLPPFEAQHTMGAMGASIGVLHGMSLADIPEPRVCTIGDSTFFHSGMAPLVNMVHNRSRGVVILMDNSVTAMTGHQDHPGLNWAVIPDRPARKIEIEPLVKAMGVEKVKVVDAFNIAEVEAGLKQCLDTEGPSVLITRGECVFVSQNPEPAYRVDLSVCVACQLCFKVGCPAIGLASEKNPKNNKFKSYIEPTLCTGCDICRQVCPTGAIQPPKEKEASE